MSRIYNVEGVPQLHYVLKSFTSGYPDFIEIYLFKPFIKSHSQSLFITFMNVAFSFSSFGFAKVCQFSESSPKLTQHEMNGCKCERMNLHRLIYFLIK